jgi:hypothetical protein
MALIKCPECGNNISDQAKNCPYCGREMNKMPGKGMFMGCLDAGCMSVVWVVMVIIALIFIVSMC